MPLYNPASGAGLSNPVTVAQGGTGQNNAPAALTALTGTQAAGQVLRSDGTNSYLQAIAHGDLPSLDNISWPGDHNLIAWAFDPANAASNSTPTLGVVHLIAVMLRTAKTISNLIITVATAGGTLTSGQNFAALFDATGVQRGITADQTTPWGSAGNKVMALTSSYAAAAGMYWIALLANGTTAPSIARGTSVNSANAMINNGLSVSTARFATNGSALTAMPASITVASNAFDTAAWWAAVS